MTGHRRIERTQAMIDEQEFLQDCRARDLLKTNSRQQIEDWIKKLPKPKQQPARDRLNRVNKELREAASENTRQAMKRDLEHTNTPGKNKRPPGRLQGQTAGPANSNFNRGRI